MKKSFAEIQKIVKDIRREFEQGQISDEKLGQLYLRYNPGLVGINTFINSAKKAFPALNCGLASVYLQSILGGEIIRGSYNGNNHTFLFSNNFIVDITADQYGGPKIYIGNLKLPWNISRIA